MTALSWERKDAGWYVSRCGRFEVESVERIGGGGDAHEWIARIGDTDDPQFDERWLDTVASYKEAKECCEVCVEQNINDPESYPLPPRK